MIANFNPDRALALAQQTFDIEAQAVLGLKSQVSADFARAVEMVLGCTGRVVVSGMGKSGHIARKIAATLASTGTPAFFVHPAEASHGDLGMVTRDDVFIGFSNSGEVSELNAILPLVKRLGAKLIAVTGNPESSLGKHADVVLTASTTAQIALGDALAVAVLDARGFGAEDFARSHPGGSLGRKLLTHVRDVMRAGDAIPRVQEDTPLSQALMEITRKGMAMTAVVDADGHAVGVFTDGDLRRLLETPRDWRTVPMTEVMHHNPRSIGPDQLAVEAVEVMETHRINQLLVVDAAGVLVGALHIHDLTRAKVI